MATSSAKVAGQTTSYRQMWVKIAPPTFPETALRLPSLFQLYRLDQMFSPVWHLYTGQNSDSLVELVKVLRDDFRRESEMVKPDIAVLKERVLSVLSYDNTKKELQQYIQAEKENVEIPIRG